MSVRFLSVRRDQPRQSDDRAPAVAAPVPFWDAVTRSVGASAEDQWRSRTGGWREAEWTSSLWRRHREVEQITGQKIKPSAELNQLEVGPEGDGLLTDLSRGFSNAVNAPYRLLLGDPSIDEYEARIDALRAQYPALAAVPTRTDLWKLQDAELQQVRQKAQAASGQGIGGAVGGFVGGTGAAIADPVNLVAAVATGGWGAGRPLLARLAAQGAAGAGVELTQAPGRAVDAERYGGPKYTAGEAALDVVFGGVGGAGVEALASGGSALLRAARARFVGSAEPEARGVGEGLDRLLDDEATIGAADDFDAAREALATGGPLPRVEPEQDLDSLFANQSGGPVSETVRQMQPGSAADVSDGPVLPSVAVSQRGMAGGLEAAQYHGRTIYAGRFDPMTVEVDAARFQYKAEGDAEGVTNRLRGVERWDATASGKAILFEDLDGRVIVADGHQRRGLARRLAEQGWEDAQLDGYLFRARDGWTDRQVRVVAALKNIREGSGAVMDAAKLSREAPGAMRDRSLPITGDFIHQARQLASLSDDGFRAVVNKVIPERYAAVIGEQAGDRPDLHGDLVELIRRGEPKSAEGARALVQEGLLDDFIKSEGRQMDLFGGLPRESTVIARGRIREAVMGALRRDEKLNAALVRNAEAIEAGGNILARSDNERRLAVDRAASELVSRLALRSGEMGEAFAEAAAAVTKGETTPGAAAKGLTARIRAAVAAGEDLDAVRAEVIDPAPPSAQALETAGLFGVPAGEGQRSQIAPKPEDAEIEAEGPPGLFDDLDEPPRAQQAADVLRRCAPGGV
ncbi:MAG: hypothetical protein KJ728_11920 [Alphaproteobacteria bacterium]|uniref:Uncharacterized protein n=1 Tax=viral metagenome TaxID=1070528 RepID=A0A6M3XDI6_9ZZZZ|nr:hypothetical protein [Alphaproteobacteria bacterium]